MNFFNFTLDDSIAELFQVQSKFSKFWNWFWPLALSFLGKLILVLIIFFVGKKLINLLLGLVKKGFERTKVDEGVSGFIRSVLNVVLYFLLIMIIANVVGIATTSAVALVGSVGLTVGLALQGSLSNFAGGVLLLVLKPFIVGDYIVAQGLEGTVTKIDIFYTTVLTVDNRTIVLPNGTLSNGNIVNVTHEPTRRLDLIVPIGYEDDIRKVKALLLSIANHHTEQILQDHDVVVMVSDFGDDAVEIAFRVWVKKEDYWTTRSDLLEEIKYTFDEQHITIPFHQLDVFMKKM
jgi:small conductance mechanosensitive channel